MQAQEPPPPGTRPQVRYLITSTGGRIGWDICRNWDCMRFITACACPDGPRAPDYETGLIKTDNSLSAVLARVAGSAPSRDETTRVQDAA